MSERGTVENPHWVRDQIENPEDDTVTWICGCCDEVLYRGPPVVSGGETFDFSDVMVKVMTCAHGRKVTAFCRHCG